MSSPGSHQPPITPGLDDCPVCRQLRLEGPDENVYVVSPAHGGGWAAWSGALLRLFRRIGAQPTQAVIIDQPTLFDRYVQVLVGHGVAHAEASSNVYIEGPMGLTPEVERMLTQLGWLPPEADHDDPYDMPANWYVPLIHGDWQYLTELLLATMAVFAFDEALPIRVYTFAAQNPCRACSWPADEELAPSVGTSPRV